MDQPTTSVTSTHRSPQLADDEQFDRSFKPTGAIAFFVLLVLLSLAIWYGVYWIMIERI